MPSVYQKNKHMKHQISFCWRQLGSLL